MGEGYEEREKGADGCVAEFKQTPLPDGLFGPIGLVVLHKYAGNLSTFKVILPIILSRKREFHYLENEGTIERF